MADSLRLLFELDVDHRAGTAGLLRWRKEIAATVAATRRAFTQPITLPPIKPSVVPAPSRGSRGQVDAHVKDFRRIEAEAKKSANAQEREQKRLNSAVQSLQRQRSAAIIAGWKAEERAAIASMRAQERAAQQASRSIATAFRGIGPGLQSIGRTLTLGITAPLLALGAASLKSAKDLDANVNTLKAFTGSAEAAEQRLAQLIKTARGTPGLTTNLALILDAQLRVAQTTEETIDRVLPAIGRLNAVSKLPDAARFTQNLLQLVTQNFERQDLKELVGQSPLAGQLITEIFKVDSPTNAKAIREAAQRLGLTTTEAFFAAFAEAAQRNQGLATVTESIGTRFEKVVDRVTVALRPLGLAIINAIEPFVEPVAKLVERIGEAFNSLSTPVKTAIIVIAGIAAAAGPVLFILGGLATAITSVVTAIGTISAAVAAVGLPVIAVAIAGIVVVIAEWIAILTALGLAWKTNFLGIQELVSDAATVVVESFSRIKAIITEATERILPTLESITTKVLGIVTAAWNKYGRDVVAVLGAAFRFISRIIEDTLETFGNFVDLIAKLINGDFRGAWAAFARIHITALQAFEDFLNKLGPILIRAFGKLHVIILAEGVRFVAAGQALAVKLVIGITTQLVRSASTVRDALVDMFLLAAQGINPTTISAIIVARFIAALRRAAEEALGRPSPPPPPVTPPEEEKKKDKPKPPPSATATNKGADAETRRRIRLLELEAERAEAIARQRIAAENIHFDQRRTSLQDFTDFQIKEEEAVLEKKKAVFAAERAEAEKLGKGRDLALGEIRLKELKAELDFADRKNQLLANQRREELEAVKAHRKALLDIQEQADDAELARLEDLQRQGHVTAFDVATRQAEIDAEARKRRRAELEIQLKDADKNKEDRERIIDELKQFDAESAESVKRNERFKREALQETADAYRDYVLIIQEALEATGDAVRSAGAIALSRLNARVFLTQQERIKRQFALDKRALDAEKRASDLRIDNAEREAVEKAKRAGEYEQKALEIERTFNGLRLAEQKRFEQQRKKLAEDAKADLERAGPNSTRSLFGDTFADFGEALRVAADSVGIAISNLTVILGSFGAAAAEHFAAASASAGNFISILLDGIDQIVVGLGDMLQDWVLLGETGSAALRKLLASTLAYYAKTFLIKALDNVAEGISNLAKAFAAAAGGNFASAAAFKAAAVQNFLAAAKYGLAAAGAAVAGRFAAGDSFRQDTARSAVRGGQEAQPQNREFQFGGTAIEPSSVAAREGSAAARTTVIALMEGLADEVKNAIQQNAAFAAKLDGTLSRIGSMPAGDVLVQGAAERPDAVAVAVIEQQKADNGFSREMATNMGF